MLGKLYAIATANKSTAVAWKNKTMTWAEFVDWQRDPRRTEETVAEYAALSKTERADIKNGPCYVAGCLASGRRRKGSIKSRSMVVLDADSAASDLWDAYTLLLGYQALMYPTHSFTDALPKYRLVVPLAREVSAEEYVPLSLKIAETLGFKNFDTTTYQPERLMYKSSCSKDAAFKLLECTGPLLDPDMWLALYDDWRDVASWPLQGQDQRPRATKAQDPAEKRGIIGAFCRTYPVSAAIETFLGDAYATAREGRYTLIGGSSYGGVVCYDDKWVYSNHATDPAGGKLCNAFDLVRIHRYGDLDKDAAEGTPVTSLPSYKEMCAFAFGLEDTKAELDRETLEGAKGDFDKEVKGESWLSYTKNGVPQISYVRLAKEIASEIDLYYNGSEFLRYDADAGIWRGGSEYFVRQYIQQRKLGELTNNSRRSEALQALQNELYTPESFDRDDPSVIVLANGLYHIPTGEFRVGFDPSIRARTRHAITYDADAKCPAFTELVSTMYGVESLPFIFEWFGYCLYRAYPLKALLMLYGKRDTGKSTLINLLQRFVGEDGYSNITLKSLCNKTDRFSTINLLGKTLNVDADAKAEYIGDGSELKVLVGGDTISAEAKGLPFVQFKNYAKLVFGLNRLPTASVAEAIASKMKILETNPPQYTPEAFSELLGKATSEMSGIFNEAMIGLRRALKNKQFSETKKMTVAADAWQLENDNVALFISERVGVAEGKDVKTSEMYVAYKRWCAFCERKPLGKHAFNRTFEDHGYQKYRKGSEVWPDITLKEEDDDFAN